MHSKSKSVTLSSVTVVVLSLGFFVACGRPDAANTSAFPALETVWQSSTVETCWEDSAWGFAEEREWSRNAVLAAFGGTTRLRFVGWERCPQGAFAGIRIAHNDSNDANPRVIALGQALRGRINGMSFNFTFGTWSQACQQQRERCIGVIAVHEFGHAVGLAHEQNRPDTPASCTDSPQGSNIGAAVVGPWDLDSIMNYCNPVYNNNGRLSPGDVDGLAFLYGSPVEVACPAGYTPKDGHYCQRQGPADRLVHWRGRWLKFSGMTDDGYRRVFLSDNGQSINLLERVLDRVAGAGLAQDTRVPCPGGAVAYNIRLCSHAGGARFTALYQGVWYRFVGYPADDRASAVLEHEGSGARQTVPWQSLAPTRTL